MITEKDIELIENYLHGNLSPNEVTDFEKRVATDKEFSSELSFMKDLVHSIKNNQREDLRDKLKKIKEESSNDFNSEEQHKPINWTKLSLAAAITITIGLSVYLYFAFKNSAPSSQLATKTEINNIIKSSRNQVSFLEVNNVDSGLGYAGYGPASLQQIPLCFIHSDKWQNHYLVRDTLFLLTNQLDSASMYSISKEPSYLFLKMGNVYYTIETVKKDTILELHKTENPLILDELRGFKE